LGSAFDTVACEGISIPKWAKADPDIAHTTTIANQATCVFFIIFSLSSHLIFFDEVKKKATSFRRLHDARPSWLKVADFIV
jgi:hypothetical protein